MSLTPAQENTLETYLVTTAAPEFDDEIAAFDDQLIADAMNTAASPSFWVWKTVLLPADYRAIIVWTEVDALTVAKARIFEWMTGLLTQPLNPSDLNQRQGIADTFGAGATTRTNLLTLGRRLATRAEKLFATGTGSTASPATMAFEGQLSYVDIARTFGRGL